MIPQHVHLMNPFNILLETILLSFFFRKSTSLPHRFHSCTNSLYSNLHTSPPSLVDPHCNCRGLFRSLAASGFPSPNRIPLGHLTLPSTPPPASPWTEKFLLDPHLHLFDPIRALFSVRDPPSPLFPYFTLRPSPLS